MARCRHCSRRFLAWWRGRRRSAWRAPAGGRPHVLAPDGRTLWIATANGQLYRLSLATRRLIGAP